MSFPLSDHRMVRGKIIAETDNQIERINSRTYRVVSQSGNGTYDVLSGKRGWKCSCPDHTHRGVKCKHIWAVEFSYKLRNVVHSQIIEPLTESESCVYCGSKTLARFGLRHNKYGAVQKLLCKSCGKHFTSNLGFTGMEHGSKAITTAMQLYFSGESLRNTAKSLRLIGVQVSHKTVYKWIQKYVGLMEKYLEKITPQVSDTWRADEMWLKIKGNPKYLYALMDDETRYWIAKQVAGEKFSQEAAEYASSLFRQARQVAGKRPMTLITDGLHAYHLAWRREFYSNRMPQARHIEHITWKGQKHDNRKMERFNGEIRDREKVMRSLKREDTPILTGYQIFHNYLRPHEALDGRTPAEACGINIKGENKWITIIQNAAKKSASTN